MIPDPRGRPSHSDQSPFSARRRSIVTRGGIIMKPPGVFSFCHPGCRNGNESLKSGQRVAAWPILPQEKHITSDQSLRNGRCFGGGRCRESCRCCWRCPSMKERNICYSRSILEGLYPRDVYSAAPSPTVVTIYPYLITPASEPDAPRSKLRAGASPLTEYGLFSVR